MPPYGLDFGTVMAVGTARGVDLNLLSSVLVDVERAIINGLHGDREEEGDDG